MIRPCAFPLVLFLISFISEGLASYVGSCFSCLVGWAMMGWWITGFVWRFKVDGSYAAGDFLSDEEF